MNLTELCSIMPKNLVRDSDAVSILRASMEATGKVYKRAKMYFAQTDEQDQLVQKAINKIIAPFNMNEIVWKGIYGEPSKMVEYWYFMAGILVIRGIDQRWAFMGPHMSKRKWKELSAS